MAPEPSATPMMSPPADPGLLAEIAAGLATASDLSALLARFLDPIIRLAGARAGAVLALSEAGDQFELVSALGLPDKLCSTGHAVDRHCGHCGAAADAQHMVWAKDLAACAKRTGSAFFGQAGQHMLAVPLQHRGRTLGVYNLFFAGDAEPSAAVQQILRAVGELLGLALNNARLEDAHLRATLMQERQSMAAELHDSLGQSLAFVKMRMPLLRDALLAHDDARALQYHDDVRREMTQAHASLRCLITHFRSPMDPQGLAHALTACTESFRRSTGTALEFVNELPGLQLPAEHEVQVFHIVQEALSNVARHAGAQHARVQITADRAHALQIVVEDDGQGVPVAAARPSGHYGLEIMQERARRIGGSLHVGPRPGGGTRVRLAFPVPAAATSGLRPAGQATEAHAPVAWSPT